MQYLLNILYLCAGLAFVPVWAFRIVTGRKRTEGLLRRFLGTPPSLPRDSHPVIWLHAASVGEVLPLRPLLDHFEQVQPCVRTVISTETPEGHRAARIAFPEVPLFFVPFDLTWSVRRVYRAIRPRLLVLSELELWPNLLMEARRRGIPVAVVNSRMNDADFRYFRSINRTHRHALAGIGWWGAQTTRDAERIRELLGTAPTVVAVTGSLKYDVVLDERAARDAPELGKLLGFRAQERIWIAGSTHAPEESILLDVFRDVAKDHPELRLVLVPRNTHRFREVAELLRKNAVSFVKRSDLKLPPASSAPVTLIDSVGELPALWRLADIAFVGGSLAPDCGGQNMIEPAAFAKPVCFGPNVWNFSDVASGLLSANGACQVTSGDELAQTIRAWLGAPENARRIGESARAFVESQRGAASITIRALDQLLDASATAPGGSLTPAHR